MGRHDGRPCVISFRQRAKWRDGAGDTQLSDMALSEKEESCMFRPPLLVGGRE